jgi:hypothetical protein
LPCGTGGPRSSRLKGPGLLACQRQAEGLQAECRGHRGSIVRDREPNSWWSRMIKSQALQRTTPSIAGIEPSSTRPARNALCSPVSLSGAPGDDLLMRPSDPCSLNRITQSRGVCRSMPPILAASSRVAPSSAAAIANNRRTCAALHRCATRRTSRSYSPSVTRSPAPWQTTPSVCHLE